MNNHRRIIVKRGFYIAVGGCLLLFLLLQGTAGANIIPLVQTSVITPPVSLTIIPTNTIFSVTPSVLWYDDLPPEKRDFIVQEEQELLHARQTVSALATLGIIPSPVPTLIIPTVEKQPLESLGEIAGTGVIINNVDNITPPVRRFETLNFWVANIQGAQIQVYTGSFIDSPTQGVLVVRWIANGENENIPSPILYNIPLVTGLGRIVAASGSVIELQSDDGQRIFFDPISGVFLNNLNETPITTPVITPIPYPAPIESGLEQNNTP
jgi:hypothetical protein